MNDNEFEEWVNNERCSVEQYLERQGITNPNVGPWPAFDLAPKFAIWAVESKKCKGKIGWWAFSGDIPTDYVSEDGKCHPRNALIRLLNQWRDYIPYMKNGKHPPNTNFGESAELHSLAILLERRIQYLDKAVKDDGLWEDR